MSSSLFLAHVTQCFSVSLAHVTQCFRVSLAQSVGSKPKLEVKKLFYHQNMNTTNATPIVISLDTACAITEMSKSTWRRRIAKGDFTRVADDARGRAMLLWSEVESHICIPIETEDQQFIFLSDAGNAEAQDDIGQLFLISEKHQSAFYWFQKAAQQNNPDAMQWLGHCYVNGKGVPKDENLGMMWIAKAAALGNVIAQGLMKGLISRALDSQLKV